MRILFLSRWFPHPTDNGSKLRIRNLLKGLSNRHEISLISFIDADKVDFDRAELRTICEDVKIVPWRPYNPNSKRALMGFVSLTPRSHVDTFSQEMVDHIEKTITNERFDLIIASQWEMARYYPHFGDVPALFEEVELGVYYGRFNDTESLTERMRHGLTWYKQRRYLSRLLPIFRASTVVSEEEKHLLNQAVPGHGRTEIIPNCIDLTSYSSVREEPQDNRLIFTGPFSYPVNYWSILWFLDNVYPHIREEVPEVSLAITGDPDSKTVPPNAGVRQTGFVDDVRPLIASSWASIVPLQSGGGTRLKILEAMALRTPVVTTSKGAEGLNVKNGETVLIADEPREFATAVVRLLKNRDLRDQLADNAYQLVSKHYDWAGVMPRFLQLVEETARAA